MLIRSAVQFTYALVLCSWGVAWMAAAAHGAPQEKSSVASARGDARVAGAINRTGIELLEHCSAEKNVVFSPQSASTVFAMVYPGARGETARQLASTMHFRLPRDIVPRAYGSLLFPEGAPSGAEIVNGLWLQEDYPLEPSYLDLLKDHFHVAAGSADFLDHPSSARQDINDWIAQQTKERITSLLPEGAITQNTRLVLANTVFFRGAWEYPFRPSSRTLNWKRDGRSLEVPALSQREYFRYVESVDYQAVELPYKDSSISMVLVLPAENLPWGQFRAKLGTSIWKDLRRQLGQDAAKTSVRLVMPKFHVASRMSLKEVYERKMPLPFSEKADFSGITTHSELKIWEAVHQAYIQVDEYGTEAGAASSVVAGLKLPAEAEFVADHPFVFLLWDRKTNSMLFFGQFVWPES